MRKTLLVVLTTFALVLGFTAVAGAAAPTKAYKVSIKTSTTASEAGKFITVSGKVSGPKSAGKTVKIQRLYAGGAWVTVATAKTSKKGKYAARVETPRGGTTSFRAVKAKSSVRKAGVSPTAALPVYEWLDLANEGGWVSSGEVFSPTELQLPDGVLYKRSMALYDGDASLFYKLDGKCTKFTTRAGYRSGNPSDTDSMSVVVEVSAGTTTYPVNLGSTVTINRSVAAENFLQIDFDSVDANFVAGLGNPRVYCNSDRLASFDSNDF